MLQAQILIGDPHEGNPGSAEVNKDFFANNWRLKRVGDTGVVSLCLSRHEASTECNSDLLGSPRELDLKSNLDLTFQGHHTYVSTRLWNTMTS